MLEDPAGIDYSSDTRPVLLRTARWVRTKVLGESRSDNCQRREQT